MEKRIAIFISYIFHPILITTYTIFLMFSIKTIYNISITWNAKLIVLSFVFLTTFIFPLLLVLALKYKGMIKTLQMETREERIFPYIMTTIFYYFTYYMLCQIHIPVMFQKFVLGATLLIVMALIINFWWKISIHMIAIGGMIGCITGISLQLNYDMRLLIGGLFLIAGLIGFSRLKLNLHNQSQIYFGILMGFVVMLCLFL